MDLPKMRMSQIDREYDLTSFGYCPPAGEEPRMSTEKAILGAILIDHTAFSRAAQYITPEHFGYALHGAVFASMKKLWDKGTPIDAITVAYQLIADGVTNSVSNGRWVSFLSQRVTGAFHIEAHCELLREYHRRSVMTKTAEKLVRAGDPTQSSSELLHEVTMSLNIAGEGAEADEETMSHTWHRLMDEPPQEPPMKMGMGLLDNSCGLAKGSLNLIASYQGTGKTAFAINVMLNVAEAGKNVWMVSVEMDKDDLNRRAHAIYTGIDGYRIFNGPLTPQEKETIAKCGHDKDHITKRISVDKRGEMELQRFMATAERKAREGCDLIVVDYVQLLTADVKLKTEYERVTAISHGLRRTARLTGIPILAVSQLRKGSHTETNPTMNDIRSTGQLAQDASLILMLSKTEKGGLVCNIAKNRNGKTGDNLLDVDFSCFRMGPRAFQPVAPF